MDLSILGPWAPYGVAGLIISLIVIPAARAIWKWWVDVGYPAGLKPLQDISAAVQTLITMLTRLIVMIEHMVALGQRQLGDIQDIKEDVAGIYTHLGRQQPSRKRQVGE